MLSECVCVCGRWMKSMKGEKAPRCYLKKNRRLCTQLFEISRLLFSNCLLSSAKIAIRSRLHIWQILLALLMLLLAWWRMLHSISGLVPYLSKYCQTKSDNLVLFFLFTCLKVYLCPVYLSLKWPPVEPIYTLSLLLSLTLLLFMFLSSLSLHLTRTLYTTFLIKQLPCNGQFILFDLRQLQFLPTLFLNLKPHLITSSL